MTLPGKREVMSEEEFSLFRDLIEREFGILLKGDRRLTLHTKVSRRLRLLGFPSYRAYYEFILSDPSREELFTLASHITNKETYFFRDKAQLDVFTEILRELKRQKQDKEQRLHIVSLASSSGEEAYSLNILLYETRLFLWTWDVLITGIDIDRNAISKAVAATYTSNSFRVPERDTRIINKYFMVEDGCYRLKNAYKKNVSFSQGNILDDAVYDRLSPVDIIFCRNVLIYMSDAAYERLVRNFYRALTDGGYLFIGSAENLMKKTNLFVPEYRREGIVYRKNRELL